MFRAVAVSALLVSIAFLVQDFHLAEACAPTTGNSSTMGRKKRSIQEDVHVVVLSSRPFEPAKNEENMKSVEQKLKEFADVEGISFRRLQALPRTAENVDGKFGVHFTAEGEFEKCARVLQFIQSATNEIEEVVSSTVKCGDFDAVHVTKKKGKESAVPEGEELQHI